MTFIQKYSLIIAGSAFLILGLLILENFFPGDLSKNAAKVFIICGALSVFYYFIRKKKLADKK
jgi:hypothetical protein